MKRIIAFLVIGTLVLSGIVAVVSSETQDFKSKKEQIVFSKPIIKEEMYTSLEIDEANSYLIKENRPIIPKYTKTYVFPSNTEIIDVKCTVKNIDKIEISKKLQPSPKITTTNSLLKKVNDKPSYTFTETYPENWYEYDIGSGIVGDERKIIVKVDFLPLRYNPSENYISSANEINIDIDYETKREPIDRYNDDEYDLLILTPNKYTTPMQPLINHKNNRGVSTKLVTLNEITNGIYFPVEGRDQIEEIKYFIKNAIDNWFISNVMIVGGAIDFPAREAHIFTFESDDEIFLTDMYYADIYDGENNFETWDTNENNVFAEYDWDDNYDDMDLYPDVKLARLACTDEEELEIVVDKIINYENGKSWAQNWFNNIVVIGGDTFPNENDRGKDISEGEHVNQVILDIMDGFIPDKIWDSNGRLGNINPSGVDSINDGINKGCGFVDFSGHGAPWVWTTYPYNGNRQSLPSPFGRYTNDDISDLENNEKLPIAINGGCSLGKYASDANCFAWAYLSNPNGGGIASCGCTGLGWVYGGTYASQGLVEGMTVDMFQAFKDGAYTFGDMWSGGVNDYIYSNMNSGDYKTILEWQPFGDPTLQIAEESTPPARPNRPEGDTSGKSGESYEYKTSTTEPDNDKIYYLFEWGDETFSEWIGPYNSGEEVTATHTWEKKGDYQIRVKAKDEHGVQSEWSNPLTVSMPKQKSYDTNPIIDRIIQLLIERFPVFTKIIQI